MGKLFAALITVYATLKLAPMCARLPDDLSGVYREQASSTEPAAPAPAPVPSAVPPVAAVQLPAPAPSPAPPPATPAAAPDSPGVVVSTYRMKAMFKITDGRGMVSVSVKNLSASAAKDLKLILTAVRGGRAAERLQANAFDLAASSSLYRGLRLSMETIDAMLAAEPGAELRWDLSYALEGEDSRRCHFLRALPRAREPEGVEWTKLESGNACPKP